VTAPEVSPSADSAGPGNSTRDVSRETTRREVFGPGYETAVAYERLLSTVGVERGLVGPREADRMWDRHLLNCAVAAAAVPEGAYVVDLGSGAGLPGLVLAIVRPDLTICLVEPLLRRATFLEEAVDKLGLPGVQVRRARAEELHGALLADVVTARAVAPLDRLTDWGLPLVRPGGTLLALKGEKAAEELAAVEADLPRRGASAWSVEILGSGVIDPPTRVVRIVRSETASAGPWSSAIGKTSKRPATRRRARP
jgi:16S rRNA (guanine527-N7)-methyltransferase